MSDTHERCSRADGQWLNIESAPKSPAMEGADFGVTILLGSTSGHRAIGYWGQGASGYYGWVNPHDHQVMAYWNAFTHWQPLPPPPQGE